MELIASGIWKITLGNPEEFTPVKVIKPSAKTKELKKLPNDNTMPFNDAQIKMKVMKRGCIVEIPMDASEKVYGFGLQLKSFNQEGKKKQLRTNADPIADTGDTHAPVPFYVSTKGYGVLVDTARYVSFYCGGNAKLTEDNADIEERNSAIADNTDALYAVRELKDDRSMVIEVPNVMGVDIYIFEGPDMKTAIQRYNLFSGGGCIPPIWGLGIWYRAYGRANAEQAAKIAEDLRQQHMPCDVFGLEPGWHSHSYSCSYQWDPERFSKPGEFIGKLKQMDFKINLWEHIFVHSTSPIYSNLKKYSGDYKVWNGLVPDLSIKEAGNIFAEYHKNELVDRGITGFKLDECDSSDYTGGWSFPNCSEFPSGMDGEQMHSMIGMFYQQTIFSIFKGKNLRTYNEVRSSHAFAAPLPFVLYSDLYDHRDFIRGVVNMGFTGLLWSPEVRHAKNVEDLLRRLQSVVFSPQALINAWYISNPPWKQVDRNKNLEGELMEHYEQVQHQCRKIFELRMSFIPYLYSCFAKYYFQGIPPFRALVMDYPADTNTYEIDDQYMMGDSILVAPVTLGENNRKVYLPEGNWYCFWTNKKYEGNQEYNIEVPIEQIPIFVKEGSLIPLAKPVEFITKNTCFEVTIYGYGEQCDEFLLFEDDGFTFDFTKGNYNHIHLKWNSDGHHGAYKTGSYKSDRYRIIGWERIL